MKLGSCLGSLSLEMRAMSYTHLQIETLNNTIAFNRQSAGAKSVFQTCSLNSVTQNTKTNTRTKVSL